MFTARLDCAELVIGVSGSVYNGYLTRSEGAAAYAVAVEANLVRQLTPL